MPKGVVALPVLVGGRVEEPDAGDSKLSKSGTLVSQWPGTYFEAAFRGGVVYLRTGKGRQGLELSIDGQPAMRLVSAHPGVYRVAGLRGGSHTVRLEVVTESQSQPAGFGGFYVPGRDRLRPGLKPTRQMEFIGDSYSVGYGNASAMTKCSADEIWATTDTSKAFGPLLAKRYGADYQVNAISGRGVVRNYNGGAADTLPAAYPFVLFDRKERYLDVQWQPQVIDVGLGTNDFSTPLHPGERWTTREALHEDYEETLVHFVEELRERHPGALFILWATDDAHGEIQAEVRRVVERLRTKGEAKVEFVPIDGLQMTGCDAHPSEADDKTIAVRLSAVIEAHPEVWSGR